MSAQKTAFATEPDSIKVYGDAWVESVKPSVRPRTRLGQIFEVTEEEGDIIDAVLTKGQQIGHLDRLYFECNDFDRVGDAIVERHENYSPDGVPERLRVDNILTRHPSLDTAEAQQYKELMLQANFTYTQSITHIDRRIRADGYDKTISWLEQIADEMSDCEPKDEVYNENTPQDADLLNVPATVGYHKIEGMFEEPEPRAYLDGQPSLVRRLLTTPQRCNLEQLAKLGKGCFVAEKTNNPADYQQAYLSLTNSQRAVFWTNYALRKKSLTIAKPITNAAKGLHQQILRAGERDLAGLKRRLWRIQKGKIRIKHPPRPEEWGMLWNTYRQKEYQLNNPLPEIPKGRSRCSHCFTTKGGMYRPKLDVRTGKLEPMYSRADGIMHCLTCDGF